MRRWWLCVSDAEEHLDIEAECAPTSSVSDSSAGVVAESDEGVRPARATVHVQTLLDFVGGVGVRRS